VIELDPTDPDKLSFALSWAVRKSGLKLADITQQLDERYGVQISTSALSHVLSRGTIRLQRALQILAICGVTEVQIKGGKSQ
jgi:hypothetical protein